MELQTRETTQTLVTVAAESRTRDEALGLRLQVVERDGAVRETEQRATTRALEGLTEEIRDLRTLLQRRSR